MEQRFVEVQAMCRRVSPVIVSAICAAAWAACRPDDPRAGISVSSKETNAGGAAVDESPNNERETRDHGAAGAAIVFNVTSSLYTVQLDDNDRRAGIAKLPCDDGSVTTRLYQPSEGNDAGVPSRLIAFDFRQCFIEDQGQISGLIVATLDKSRQPPVWTFIGEHVDLRSASQLQVAEPSACLLNFTATSADDGGGSVCDATLPGLAPVQSPDLSLASLLATLDAHVPKASGVDLPGVSGRWQSTDPCFAGAADEWSFDIDGATHTRVDYSDLECTTIELTTKTTYFFAPRGPSPLGDDIEDMDLAAIQTTYSPATDNAASQLTTDHTCHKMDWQAGSSFACPSAFGDVVYRTYKINVATGELSMSANAVDPSDRHEPTSAYRRALSR